LALAFKHPVEFSRNKHTPHELRRSEGPVGQLFKLTHVVHQCQTDGLSWPYVGTSHGFRLASVAPGGIRQLGRALSRLSAPCRLGPRYPVGGGESKSIYIDFLSPTGRAGSTGKRWSRSPRPRA